MTFRGCRYQVVTYVPNESLWSHHSSFEQARRSYVAAVNNQRGDHAVGTRVVWIDIGDGERKVLSEGMSR